MHFLKGTLSCLLLCRTSFSVLSPAIEWYPWTMWHMAGKLLWHTINILLIYIVWQFRGRSGTLHHWLKITDHLSSPNAMYVYASISLSISVSLWTVACLCWTTSLVLLAGDIGQIHPSLLHTDESTTTRLTNCVSTVFDPEMIIGSWQNTYRETLVPTHSLPNIVTAQQSSTRISQSILCVSIVCSLQAQALLLWTLACAERKYLSEERRCKVLVYWCCWQTVWLPPWYIEHWLHTVHVLYSWSLSGLTACMDDTVPSHPGVCQDCWSHQVCRSGVDLYQPSASHWWTNLGSGWVLPTGGQLVPRSRVWDDRDVCTIPGALWWPHNCHSDGHPSHSIYHPGGGSHYNVLYFVPYQMQAMPTERKVRQYKHYNIHHNVHRE